YLTAGLVDRGLSDYSLEGAACKVFGTETMWSVVNDALQIAGGNGFMEEYPYERALRDSRINMIFEGTNEILRVLVALTGLRELGSDLEEVARALKAPLGNLGILSDYVGRKIRGYVAPERLERVAPELAVEADLVRRYTRSFGAAAETFLSRYGTHILERQYQQERLANVAVDLYASIAVLSRASSAVRRRGAREAAEEIRLARAFVGSAKYRVVGALKEMEKNRDRDHAAGRDGDRSAIAEAAYSSPGYRFDFWGETSREPDRDSGSASRKNAAGDRSRHVADRPRNRGLEIVAAREVGRDRGREAAAAPVRRPRRDAPVLERPERSSVPEEVADAVARRVSSRDQDRACAELADSPRRPADVALRPDTDARKRSCLVPVRRHEIGERKEIPAKSAETGRRKENRSARG